MSYGCHFDASNGTKVSDYIVRFGLFHVNVEGFCKKCYNNEINKDNTKTDKPILTLAVLCNMMRTKYLGHKCFSVNLTS